VVVDPNNGQILAMASVPSFDLNQFTRSISQSDWMAIKDAEADPLTNRTISAYAPGSTFKIVTALGGLSKDLDKARFTCGGGVWYGNTYSTVIPVLTRKDHPVFEMMPSLSRR
jgi:penicillin-binding protein 2